MARKSVYRSKLTGSEKVKTVVYIPKDLFERVISLAVQVYGVQRGALSLAVTEALEMWLALHTQQRTRVNPRLPLRDRYNAVMECLRAEVGTIPITIHHFQHKGSKVHLRLATSLLHSWPHKTVDCQGYKA